MNYYDELPEGYKEKYVVDAGNKKFGIIFNLVALAMVVAIIVPTWFIKGFTLAKITENIVEYGITCLVALIAMILYIILHELTHGLFYKIFTHKKLTFGLKITCAYCGVPSIYSKKIPMLVTVLAPFVIFNIIFLPFLFILPANVECLAVLIVFAIHFSGCVGDLFVTFLLLKYPKDVLINDTGAKQTFYVKK